MTKNVLILCISMLCFSCNSTVEQSEQLMEYLINAENNLYWEAVNNDILFAAYIRPSSLLAEQEARAFFFCYSKYIRQRFSHSITKTCTLCWSYQKQQSNTPTSSFSGRLYRVSKCTIVQNA
jgi:hypothetical protein